MQEARPIDTFTSLLIKGSLRILSWIPLSALHLMADGLGALVYLLPTGTRRITLINLARVFPDMPAPERRHLARRSIQETIKTGLELGHVWYGSLENILGKVVQVTGREYIDRARVDGKGVIYAAPHLGSWEVLGIYVSTLTPITTLYKPPKIKGLNQIVAASRARAGAELVATDRHGVVRLTRALLQGGSTGILPDQQPRAAGGVFAPFFGIPAYTMTLLPKLAAKTGAVVLLAYAERLPGGRGYRIVFRPADDGIDDTDLIRAATALNHSVEQCVRALPEQYQWEYKRFRKRPDDSEPGFYD